MRLEKRGEVSTVRFSHWLQQSAAYNIGQCFLQRRFKLAAVIFTTSFNGAGGATELFSYFNQSDLDLTGDRLGHLNEEGGLVGVVFHNVVVHVDENPAEITTR